MTRKQLIVAAMLALSVAAHAQQPRAPETPQPDLYEDALQSLAEGRKNDASATLLRVIEKEPLHAGAYLEVALIQCSLGHSDEAARLFAIIETRFNPPQGILDLIAQARETGCDRWHAISASSFVFGRGIDQNVNQGASKPSYIIDRDGGQIELPLLPDFLPRHDQYTMLAAEYMREVTPNGTIGFIQYQGRRNDTLRQYDSASLYMGVESPYRFGKWTLRTTAMLGLTGLGGHFYQRQLQLQARIGPPLPLPNSLQFNLMGGITRTEYLSLTNFDSNTFELRGQFSYRKDDLYASASVGLLDDRASATRPGGSRDGVAFNLLARRKLRGDMTGELGYTRQGWSGELPYAPGLINQVRKQATHVLRGTLVYPIKKNQSLQLEARAVNNKEGISLFQYNNRLLQLSWHVQGP
mgnify:FL=1